MEPDLKKISVTIWIILAGILLYTATLWQRPLFIFEFPSEEILSGSSLKGNLLPLSQHLELFILKNAGGVPFWNRIFTALMTIAAGGVLFLAGSRGALANSAKAGALIFLLMPAVFLFGTSASPYLQQGALLTITLFSLFAFAESTSKGKLALWGAAGILAVTGTLTLFTAPLLYLTALAVLLLYLLCRRIFISGHKHSSYLVLLAFIPGAFLLPGTNWQTLQVPPGTVSLKSVAALLSAGCFPWIVLVPFLLKNFRARLRTISNEPFTLFSLIVFLCSLAGIFFTGLSGGLFAAALAGLAILMAAFMEMEYLENGSRIFNTLLWVLAIIFFSAALFLGGYGALTLYTKMLPASCKIFTPRDAWALTALVPAVSGIWFITAAGEMLHKERKFLAFCAGTAFVLLAFHGLVPLKIVENNAPVKFLTQAVSPRLPLSAPIYCDKTLLVPASGVFEAERIKYLPSPEDLAPLKSAAKEKKSFCVLTLSRKVSDALPFPKTTIRSGRFIAVFYNIDFPEMRVRKQ